MKGKHSKQLVGAVAAKSRAAEIFQAMPKDKTSDRKQGAGAYLGNEGGGAWRCAKILATPLFMCKNVTFTAISHDYIILSTFTRKKVESSLVTHCIR